MHRLQRIRRDNRFKKFRKISKRKPLTFFQKFINFFKNKELILLLSWLLFMLMILGIIITISGCKSGWSVGGLEISPSDSVHIDYLIIIDQDSTQHWYKPSIEIGDNYCYKHHIWEDVRKKSE